MNYYCEEIRLKKFHKKIRMKSLFDTCINYIVKTNIKFDYYKLPVELSDKLFTHKLRNIHPYKDNYKEFSYKGFLINYKNRITPIVYDPINLLYMVILSTDNKVVRVLSREEDKKLNFILPDYVMRSNLIYDDLRKCPYVD